MKASRRYFVIGIFGVVLAGAFVDSAFAGLFVSAGLVCLVASVLSGVKGFINGK